MLRKFWVGGKDFLLNSWACIAAALYWIDRGCDHNLTSAFTPPQSTRWRETLSHLPTLSHRVHSLLCEAHRVLGWCCDIMAKHVHAWGLTSCELLLFFFVWGFFWWGFHFLFIFQAWKTLLLQQSLYRVQCLLSNSAASHCTLTSQDEDPWAETTAELACNDPYIWHFILNSTFLTCVN